MNEPSWTIGIEEEYLLVERSTGALITKQPEGLLEKVENLRHGLVARELFSSQIEIGTGVCKSLQELRADLGLLRLAVAEAAADYDMAPIAASSHPVARWLQQQYSDSERHLALAEDLQGVTRRLVVSGMHVHVGIEDPDLRIDLMDQVSYFLPHLLSLSTSSPFWEGRDTGLKSYRMSVIETLPRTGLPERFESWSGFRRHIDVLVQAGVIKDSSMIWWHIRPSERYPTVEMRVADLPTQMEDTIALAATYVCLLRMLWRLKLENRRWRSYANFLIAENLWRAQRYGTDGELMDLGKSSLVPFVELLEEMIELIMPDAQALSCVSEIEHTREICRRGTSSDRQRAVYQQAIADGADHDEALRVVIDALISDTLARPNNS